ncbi:MAG: hypothetical protein IT350_16845, partial [Deltaproteobacteria bacterium]|nr:hypothetical protein [Deltaproteobacteria bacterium]
PNERAKTAFGFGESLEAATVHAGQLLARMCQPHELENPRLRIDVINTTSASKTARFDKNWKWDFAREGLIFNTDPMIPVLPGELLGYEAFSTEGNYKAAGMKRLVKQRVLGDVVREKFQEDQEATFVQFTTRSILDGPGGEIVPLLGVNRHDMPVTPETVRAAIDAGADYIVRGMDAKTGKFGYRYYPQRDLESSSYNPLRHAGAVWALWRVFELTKAPAVQGAADAGLRWMLDQMDGPTETDRAAGADFVALVDREDGEAKTGAAGIALLALTTHARVTGDRTHLDVMRGLARFIRFSVGPDGKLTEKYFYKPKKSKDFDYPYYPSECAAGLLALNALDPDPAIVDVAKKLLEYQRTVRDAGKMAPDIQQDQWYILAIENLPDAKIDDPLVAHAFFIGDSMVSKQNTTGATIDVIGGHAKNPSASATASRSEGTSALARIALRLGDAALAEKYRKASILAAGLQLRSQYTNDNVMFFPTPKKALGGFMESFTNPTIQIDYVQHNLCALVDTLGLMSGSAPN